MVGTLPSDLELTLYRNGPALLSRFGVPYEHWFDGDGAVTAMRVSQGRAEGAVRLVQTQGLEEELRVGRPCTSGFATVAPGLRPLLASLGVLPWSRVIKNTANTNVLYWQGRLLALWEGGLPTELDPETLRTVGETDLDGLIPWAFSAHPRRIAERRATYNFGVRHGFRTMLDLFELPDQGTPRRLGSLPLPGPTLIHDFAATPHHLVFFVAPVRFAPLPLACGLTSLCDGLRWEPWQGTEILIVPLDDPDRPTRIQTDAFFQWHFANAYEPASPGGNRTGEIVVDFVRYEDFESHRAIAALLHDRLETPVHASLCRARIDLRSQRVRFEHRFSGSCEFPQTRPDRQGRPHRFIWMAGDGGGPPEARRPWDRLMRFDMETGRTATLPFGDRVPSEPLFIPRRGGRSDDDGYLLSLVYDPARHASFLAVLDARRFEDGPLAEAWLGHHVPPTLHGTFVRPPYGR